MSRLLFAVLIICFSCANDGREDSPAQENMADITNIRVTGESGAYTFFVTLKSPDTGCDQYADWWEIIDEKESLIYRRILAHSHVNEQPFERSGGPVPIDSQQNVWIRAHMNTTGYGGTTFFGNIEDGFTLREMNVDFARNLETANPLPTGCAF